MRLLAGILVLSAAGCAQPLYEWGSYEDSIQSTVEGSSRVEEDIRTLTEEVEEARARNRPVPPGKLAHLGYLQLLAGRPAAAAAWFEAEKRVWPESARFMDWMLARLP